MGIQKCISIFALILFNSILVLGQTSFLHLVAKDVCKEEYKNIYGDPNTMGCYRPQTSVGCTLLQEPTKAMHDYGAFSRDNDPWAFVLTCDDNWQPICCGCIGALCGNPPFEMGMLCDQSCLTSGCQYDLQCLYSVVAPDGSTVDCYFQPRGRDCRSNLGVVGKCNGAGLCLQCGNGQIDSGEQCDGTNLNGKTCSDVVPGSSGTLSCKADCTFDTSGCSGGGGGPPGPPGSTTTSIPSGPITTTTSIQPDLCSPAGATRCVGLDRQQCQDVGGYLDWRSIENPSEACCDDPDCTSAKCSAAGGAWLPGAPPRDLYTTNNYCCGDDGSGDLGHPNNPRRFNGKDWMCVQDGSYKWVEGIEKQRYVSNRILYCSGSFQICGRALPYREALAKPHCALGCGFYCEPKVDAWLDRKNPYPGILSEPLGPDEQIDLRKDDLEGGYGCCPVQWCWNHEKCIENQVDESGDLYIYKGSTPNIHRCLNGSWTPAKLVYTWDYKLRGYCPDKDNQCLVSYKSYGNNNKPEAYFTADEPQCIRDGQYILDYYCHGTEWVSRTSLVATKLMQLANAANNGQFQLFCGPYKESLNKYNYTVGGRLAERSLGRFCQRGNKQFSCANNPCVLEDLTTGKVYFGVSLNTPLNDPQNGIVIPLGIVPCEVASGGLWEYFSCGNNTIYNPNVSIIIHSPRGVSPSPQISNWELFVMLLANPTRTLSNLILTGQLVYYGLPGIPLRFSVLNTSSLFSRLYVFSRGGRVVQGVYEEDKYYWGEGGNPNNFCLMGLSCTNDASCPQAPPGYACSPKCCSGKCCYLQGNPCTCPVLNNLSSSGQINYYLLVKYKGFAQNICSEVNNYTLGIGRQNCARTGDEQVVADFRNKPSDLMERWTDLTSKFI